MHAYTRKCGPSGRESTRPKDLVDILVIARSEALDAAALRNAFEVTFAQREDQALPASLPPPPAGWREPYRRLATEVDVEPDLDKAFASAEFLDPVLAGRADGVWSPQRRTWA